MGWDWNLMGKENGIRKELKWMKWDWNVIRKGESVWKKVKRDEIGLEHNVRK